MKDKRDMRCPHCGNIFSITLKQIANNTRFKCPKCRKYNWGSIGADNYGVLIGVKDNYL